MKKLLLFSSLFLLMGCTKEDLAVPVDNVTTNNLSTSSTSRSVSVSQIATVTIGSQIWMSKNLDVSTYANGETIPQVTDPIKWASLTTGAWCYYGNSSTNGGIYGKLYNWYAVNDPRGLAPAGFHIPTDGEWTFLTDFLGGVAVAGGKMKEKSKYWASPNYGATNISVFTGRPGGVRNEDGSCANINTFGLWWSSTAAPLRDGYLYPESFSRYLDSNSGWVNSGMQGPYTCNVGKGLSVRCIKN